MGAAEALWSRALLDLPSPTQAIVSDRCMVAIQSLLSCHRMSWDGTTLFLSLASIICVCGCAVQAWRGVRKMGCARHDDECGSRKVVRVAEGDVSDVGGRARACVQLRLTCMRLQL